MKVIVTGVSGRIGRYVYRELVDHDHDVLGVDILSPPPKVRNRLLVDLTDAGQVYGMLGGFSPDAVIHLGAWSNAGLVPDAKTYGDNTSGTFNIFQACTDLGIRRVISASSAQVYGFRKHAPPYLRADESCPRRPLNCYAASKVAGENAAGYFSSNYGITILSFRFMGIRTPAQIDEEIESMREGPIKRDHKFWVLTDARDAAMGCRKAIEVDEVEPGPYNITGARTVLETPLPQLIRKHFGDQVEIRSDQDDTIAPLSCEKAKAAFGYEPEYCWTESQRFPEEK